MIRRNHIFMDALYQGTPRNIIAMTVNMNGVGSKFFNVTRCQARCDKVVGIKLPYLHKSNELPQKSIKKVAKYDNFLYLCDGFQKKAQKTPANEIEKAIKIKEAYYADKQSQNR